MKMFCKNLKDQAMKIINYEKKEMIPLTDEEKESYENQKVCYICEKEFCTDKENKKNFKKCKKSEVTVIIQVNDRGAAHSNCNLKYRIPKTIPIVFHNGSTYDYQFIIKQLAREFKYYLECLGKNAEKYVTFSVPIKKVLDKDKKDDNNKNKKNGKDEKAKIITYKLRFINSCRFMQDS